MNTLTQLIADSSDLSEEKLAQKVDNFLHIHTEEIQTDGKDTFHFHRYEPTPYPVLQALFEELPMKAGDTVLDYGSGLGRLCFFANHLFHCHAIGVEFAGEFHREAVNNLDTFRGVYKDRLSFIHAPAEDFTLPDTVNMIYFFNPFSTDIFRRVISHIECSFESCPRDITLVLYYPEDNTIFYIERHTPFHLWKEIPIKDCFGKDRREKFSIYRLFQDNYAK